MVDLIFKKLNFKGQNVISILKAPEEFQRHIEAMKDVADIQTEISDKSIKFLLIFVLPICWGKNKY